MRKRPKYSAKVSAVFTNMVIFWMISFPKTKPYFKIIHHLMGNIGSFSNGWKWADVYCHKTRSKINYRNYFSYIDHARFYNIDFTIRVVLFIISHIHGFRRRLAARHLDMALVADGKMGRLNCVQLWWSNIIWNNHRTIQ